MQQTKRMVLVGAIKLYLKYIYAYCRQHLGKVLVPSLSSCNCCFDHSLAITSRLGPALSSKLAGFIQQASTNNDGIGSCPDRVLLEEIHARSHTAQYGRATIPCDVLQKPTGSWYIKSHAATPNLPHY